MPRLFLGPALASLSIAAAGCVVPPMAAIPVAIESPFTGYVSNVYRQSQMWICKPDLATDVCRGDATATDLMPDGSVSVARIEPAQHAPVDCFYVYPTVDYGLLPGNHTDTKDERDAAVATASQIAPFQGVCNLYVPVYRQVTIGTYLFGSKGDDDHSKVAYSDVEDAFLHYMGQYNHGRKFVLMGHSQGSQMILELLQKRIEHDPLMRARLVVALVVGGPVEVPKGERVGGTFDTLPLCSSPGEIGCVVAFQSRVAGEPKVPKPAFVPRPGNEIACVNPTREPTDPSGPRWFSRALFPVNAKTRGSLRGGESIQTPFVQLRDFYTATCVDGPAGYRYLAVAAEPRPGDVRQSPLNLEDARFHGTLGLHIADYQFAMGDLTDLVRRKAALAAHSPAK